MVQDPGSGGGGPPKFLVGLVEYGGRQELARREGAAQMWLECGKEVRGRAELEGLAGTGAGRLGFQYVEERGWGGAERRGAESVSRHLEAVCLQICSRRHPQFTPWPQKFRGAFALCCRSCLSGSRDRTLEPGWG